MAAVYPKQYKSFAVHKNLTETIDASHVNTLQEEVSAIQQTLGLNPQTASSALKMKTKSWATVGARLDAMQRGQGQPVCYMTRSTYTFTPPKSKTAEERLPIPMSKPSAANDPEGLFNGSSVTTTRNGWYICSGYVRCTPLNEDPEYWLGLAINGSRVACHAVVHNFNGYDHCTVIWQGPVTAGKKIDMTWRNPYKGVKTTLDEVQFGVSMLREM
jgi:hypothetical protein